MGFHLNSIKSIPAALSLLGKAGFSRRFHKGLNLSSRFTGIPLIRIFLDFLIPFLISSIPSLTSLNFVEILASYLPSTIGNRITLHVFLTIPSQIEPSSEALIDIIYADFVHLTHMDLTFRFSFCFHDSIWAREIKIVPCIGCGPALDCHA